MKTLVASFLILFAYASASALPFENPVFGYLSKYGVPEAERIRKAEEAALSGSRIVGGVPSTLGQYPYQAGLLIALIGEVPRTAVCGASLVTPNKLLTAAHCWFDGVNRGYRITVVLGSVQLFTGGIRYDTSTVVLHPNWIPALIRNDIGVIYLSSPVALSDIINTIALPYGPELAETFLGTSAIASGFGFTRASGSITPTQYLRHVSLNVIDNSQCERFLPGMFQPAANICTSGVGSSGNVGTCRGDSGGPLALTRAGRRVLIGITSFGSGFGCDIGFPAAFVRVTAFIDFINQHL